MVNYYSGIAARHAGLLTKMIDLIQLEQHSIGIPQDFDYSDKVDDIIQLSLIAENKGHKIDYKLLTLSDCKALDMTCSVCGAWSVYTNLHNLNIVNIMDKQGGILGSCPTLN